MPPDPLGDLVELPGVGAAVDRARAAVDGLRAHPVIRRGTSAVAAESVVRGARASAAIDGVRWTLDEVRQADRRQHRSGGAVVIGALRATGEAALLARTVDRAPRQVWARLHTLAAAGLADADTLGRPRDGDTDVGERLDVLTALLTQPTRASALVVAAVAHGELLALAPFATANGVVARAVGRVLLRARGLDPDGLAVPELGHLEPAYAEAARAFAAGGESGVCTWIAHCADAVVDGAREGIAVCEALARG
jgi:hypothetical protein